MKNIVKLLMFGILTLGVATSAQAICPLCTIAVGAGIGLAEWLGIDNTITGLWVGGFIVSLIVWTNTWLRSKNIKFFGDKLLVTVLYYLLIIAPLYPMGIMGNPLKTLWGIDKLLIGIIIGSISFYLGSVSYFYMKKHHNNRAYFPFQKVVMPIAPLIIFSIIFYFITK